MAKPILRGPVYETLRQRIIAGKLQPGTALGEVRLASELNVSRTPLREALRQLATEGFVEYEPHKGARVRQVTPQYLREIFIIREALEGIAARLSAVNMNPKELESVRRYFEELRPRVAQGDYRDVADMIHEVIVSASGNASLERLMYVYRGHIHWFQGIAARVPGLLDRGFREHESILTALESRDPEWAESVTRAHIRITLGEMLARIVDSQAVLELPAGEPPVLTPPSALVAAAQNPGDQILPAAGTSKA